MEISGETGAHGAAPRIATGIGEISALGFGCAAIGGRVSRKQSLAALRAAQDAGITLYDTARSYGYGESEGVLGEFLRGQRASVVICTKFGILPASQKRWKQMLKPAARTVLRSFPGLRSAVRRQVADQFVSGQFSVDAMQRSLETSLRELKTDYVDMFLMHAAPASVLQQDDLLDALARLVAEGKVRVAGISGEQPVMEKFFAARPPELGTAQFALNFSNLDFAGETRRNSDLLLVANHPFGGVSGVEPCKAILAELRDSESLPKALREKLDGNDPQLLPEVLLNCILQGTGISAVVAAMMQPRHIASNVRALTSCRFTANEIDLLREQISASQRP